jgi:hypothetical protein
VLAARQKIRCRDAILPAFEAARPAEAAEQRDHSAGSNQAGLPKFTARVARGTTQYVLLETIRQQAPAAVNARSLLFPLPAPPVPGSPVGNP